MNANRTGRDSPDARRPPPPRWTPGSVCVCAVALLALCATGASALELPPGFVSESLPFVFDMPTAIAFLPNGGLLVAEKGGIVYVVRGSARWPMWVHEEEVLNTDSRGLLGLAVDPQFSINRRLYFLYTVDPDSNGIELDHYDDTFGRLARYQVGVADSNAVDESSRSVLIGATWREGFPSGSGAHTIAALEWGADGSLLVSAGEGAHFEQTDAGGLDPGLFAAGRTDPIEDIGAFRAQDLRSLAGKVLRVDPATGAGLSSNPYFDGDPRSNRSRVWCYGLRNPFRIARRPGTGSQNPAAGDPGTLFIGDVGLSTWEELDVARGPGMNFGWPCFEGPDASPDFQASTPAHHGCATIGTPDNPAPATGPTAAFHRLQPSLSTPPGVVGAVVAGGVFYTGSSYPAPYRGGYFFGDYARDWIKVLVLDADDHVVALRDFATGAGEPVAFATDPATGDVYYVAIGTGLVRRIRYVGLAGVPAATSPAPMLSRPTPNPTRGAVTLSLDLPAPAPVRLAVFDLAGREVWHAPDVEFSAGRHELFWGGLRSTGNPVSTGVYLARIGVGAQVLVRRIAVVR